MSTRPFPREITRFRMLRGLQRRIPDPEQLVRLDRSALSASELRTPSAPQASPTLSAARVDWRPEGPIVGPAAGHDLRVDMQHLIDPAAAVPSPETSSSERLFADIQDFDRFLASWGNQPAIEVFRDKIAPLAATAGSAEWWLVRKALLTYLVSAMKSTMLPPIQQYGQSLATRQLLVMGLVELFVENPARLATPADVRDALRWRVPVLPAISQLQGMLTELGMPTPMPFQMLTRRPGFMDLYVVREEWNRYEPGEISYIENVLPGEEFLRRFVRTSETEVQTAEQGTQFSSEERDTQATERNELQQSATSDTTLSTHVDGKVDVSGTYGPATIAAHVGGSLDYTVHDTTSRAAAQAREIVTRAATRVESTVTKLRSTRTLERVKETSEHGIKNPGERPVVGVYRWVDKVQRVQTVCYPNRFVMEFEVPEPGAWLRWLHGRDGVTGILSEKPLPLTVDGTETGADLTAAHVTPENYLALGARYRASGLEPPPGPRVCSVQVSHDGAQGETSADKQKIKYTKDATLNVPEGYRATGWRAAAMSWTNWDQTGKTNKPSNWTSEDEYKEGALNDGGMWLSVGASEPVQKYAYGNAGPIRTTLAGDSTHQVGPITGGTVPVSIMTNTLNGILVTVEIDCEPTERAVELWRIQCWERIAAAYYEMRRQYDNEVAARQVMLDNHAAGVSPERNAQIVLEELKRQVIGMLLGTRFVGRGAIQWDPTGQSEPDPDLARATATAAQVQFMEQAFEWENLTFMLYPYFWADRSRWRDLARIEGPDPDYARFLRAGSARVVVPARPGFEAQVQFFMWLGVIWSGGPVPAPDDECYLSVADEIQAMQRRPDDGVPVDAWEVRLPTTLVWLENDRPLPTNPAATIRLPDAPESA